MNRFIKTVSVISAAFMLLSLCACNGQTVEYDKYVKVADNFYEVTCDSYDCDYLFYRPPGIWRNTDKLRKSQRAY